MKNKTESIAVRALLVAAALVLSWIEAQVPAFFAVPGIKLGLTNLVVLVALYRLSSADAIVLNTVRIILVGLLFGNVMSLVYSICGGVLSFIVMYILKKTDKLKIITVSVFGGVFHNVGQLVAACFFLESHYVFYYLPVLWVSGIAAGAVVGLLCGLVINKLPQNIIRGK